MREALLFRPGCGEGSWERGPGLFGYQQAVLLVPELAGESAQVTMPPSGLGSPNILNLGPRETQAACGLGAPPCSTPNHKEGASFLDILVLRPKLKHVTQ